MKQTENLEKVIEKILGDELHKTRVTPASAKGKELPADEVQMTAQEKSTALSQTMSLMYLALRSMGLKEKFYRTLANLNKVID